MWNRQELKLAAKENFKGNYWNSVLVAFIYTLFFGAASAASFSNTRANLDESGYSSFDFSQFNLTDEELFGLMLLIFGGLSIVIFVSTLIKVLVLNPLNVGCSRFFVVNQSERAAAGELGYAFKNNYGHAVITPLLKGLIIGLACCLFVIPGIILSYSYRMVPYILAEEPNLGPIEVLRKSRAMMQGNKWRSFVYDLSFIGWYILCVLTCNILSIFYVNPYFENAKAKLYIAIRDEFNGKNPQNVVDSI
ncbi:MAG: DUF975 family protein [Butyrivibrio sp.]|nr:DUF975 family protein [Butyrivibrio sp.]